MKLQDILNNMYHDLLEEMVEKIGREDPYASTFIYVGTKEIEVFVGSYDVVELTIYDEDGNDLSDKYPNFKKLIEDNCPTWLEAREEYNDMEDDHGFSSESDYIRWKYL